MSKAAYESYFGQPAPAGAVYAADISYWQGTDVWYDLINWTDSVCIRTGYGSSGDDGRQAAHFNKAAELNYGGTLGTYHYVIPNSGMSGNLSNYLSRSAPFVDRTKYDMLDFEEPPIASNQFINEMCDAVEQTRQRPSLIYGGKSYLDQAGPITCPAGKFWVAHYADYRSNAWVPTNDWNSWDAPLMPNQYGPTLPGVWQWSSTAIGYSLDLDISTTPEAFGIGKSSESDWLMALSESEQIRLRDQMGWLYAASHDDDRWMRLYAAAEKSEWLYAMFKEDERWMKLYAAADKTDSIARTIQKFDVEALASALAVKLTPSTGSVDYEKVRALLRDELSKLHLAQG